MSSSSPLANHRLKPCSNCHRLIPTPQRRQPQPQSPQAPQSPTSSQQQQQQQQQQQPSNKCNHTLCKPCTRTALLTALSTDPFTPATCPSTTLNSTFFSTSTKCCQTPLPLATIGEAATPAEFLAYRLKLREQRTPVAQRL
ncbi:hypothetical protein C8A00DRAFT_38676, partial [Chaetomidium leptoderma]